jgi:hypothetical protein
MSDNHDSPEQRSVPLYLGAALLALAAGVVAIVIAIVLVKGTL